MNGKTEEWFKCGQMVLNKQESALHLLVTRDGNLMQRRQCKDAGPIVASTSGFMSSLRILLSGSQVDRLTCMSVMLVIRPQLVLFIQMRMSRCKDKTKPLCYQEINGLVYKV